jgi:hypothetical protein
VIASHAQPNQPIAFGAAKFRDFHRKGVLDLCTLTKLRDIPTLCTGYVVLNDEHTCIARPRNQLL